MKNYLIGMTTNLNQLLRNRQVFMLYLVHQIYINISLNLPYRSARFIKYLQTKSKNQLQKIPMDKHQNLYPFHKTAFHSNNSSDTQSRTSFNLERQLELRHNLIHKIIQEWRKFKDVYYWLHILGRHPKLNSKNIYLQFLKEIALPKLSWEDRRQAKKDFEQISTLYMRMQELMALNQCEEIIKNIESMKESLRSLKRILKIDDFEDFLLNMQHENRPDWDKQQDDDELNDFKHIPIQDKDFDYPQDPFNEYDHISRKSQGKDGNLIEDRHHAHQILSEKEKEPAKGLKCQSSERISFKTTFPFKQEKEQISFDSLTYNIQNPDYEMNIQTWAEFYSNFNANIEYFTGQSIEIKNQEEELLEVARQAEENERIHLAEESDPEEEMAFGDKKPNNEGTRESEFVSMNSFEESEISLIYDPDSQEASFSVYDLSPHFLEHEFEKPDKKKDSTSTDTKPA